MRQPDQGNGNAVRKAFASASNEILRIFDPAQTVPPEALPRFVNALAGGRGESANRIRLVYTLKDKLMRCAKVFLKYGLSLISACLMAQHVEDALCRTTSLYPRDYKVIGANPAYLGEFNHFGGSDFFWGANKFNLEIVDFPIHCYQRTFGLAEIQRLCHGVMSLEMVLMATCQLSFGA